MFGNDDVARNIYNEMQRDAAPSSEEAQRDHERHLAKKGCLVCGETDPSRLCEHPMPYRPSCRLYRGYGVDSRYDPPVFCDEHDRPAKLLWEAKRYKLARDRDAVAVVWYDCGHPEYAVAEDVDAEGIPPEYREPASAPVVCQCGSHIDRVVYLDADDGR